jgi:DNA adenine methylase
MAIRERGDKNKKCEGRAFYMILRRLGNKQKIAKEIQKHFPQHRIYIEPFFGAGGMFFNKPRAKRNIVNDIDSDVFNLFNVVSTRKPELEEQFAIMPIHSDLLEYWKHNKETEPIRKALRFIFLSNFTYLGKQDTISMVAGNSKGFLLSKLDETNKLLFDVQFANFDFRKFLKSLSFRDENEKEGAFIYSDSPYLDTVFTYEMKQKWAEQDVIDLLDSLQNTECKFAMSEFDHPFVLEQAKQRNLNVITIGERKNLKSRKTEILITNYKNHATLFDI